MNLPPVGPGSHALDVAGPGLYEPAAELVDLAVYPGVRVAIAVDPVAVDPPIRPVAGRRAAERPAGARPGRGRDGRG
ncbi:hypothetical protein [Nannocystis pusilla]|uniref:hypothetical protein n=1 Tax=Nannocystis pusilla TaxID=889268 RepID=UPI003B7BE382